MTFYLCDVELESFLHENGQTRDESVEAPVEAKLGNVDGMHRAGSEYTFPGDTVVLYPERSFINWPANATKNINTFFPGCFLRQYGSKKVSSSLVIRG